jgi:prepilin-type N-terminal cleavage/methylation domain-containing protein
MVRSLDCIDSNMIETTFIGESKSVRDLSMRGKGFTLIELLVVISIISLLLSILLPTMNRIREHAKTVVCKSNQQQIFLAIYMYANDNDGCIIPMNQHSWLYRDTKTNYKWYTNILHNNNYIRTEFDDPEIGDVALKRGGVWACPSVRLKEKGWGAGYGLNERAHPYPCLYDLYSPQPTFDRIHHPDKVFSIADSREWNGAKWVSVIGIQSPNDPFVPDWGDIRSHEVAPRHLGKVVMTFFSGACDSLSYEDCRSNVGNMFCDDENGDGFYDFCK